MFDTSSQTIKDIAQRYITNMIQELVTQMPIERVEMDARWIL